MKLYGARAVGCEKMVHDCKQFNTGTKLERGARFSNFGRLCLPEMKKLRKRIKIHRQDLKCFNFAILTMSKSIILALLLTLGVGMITVPSSAEIALQKLETSINIDVATSLHENSTERMQQPDSYDGRVSLEDAQTIKKCPQISEKVIVKAPTKDFQYQLRVSYGPEYPVQGCMMQWVIEFLNKFDDEYPFMDQVQYDLLVDKDLKPLRSIAEDKGLPFLYAHAGSSTVDMVVKEEIGTAHFVVWVYGAVNTSLLEDYLQVNVPITPATVSMIATETSIPSPLAQYRSGVPIQEIECRDSKILMETQRGTPACVNEDSVQILQDRGWKLVQMTQQEQTPTTKDSRDKKKQIKTILNPSDVSDLIPQDIVIDSSLKMPPNDKESFAEQMASFASDKITNVKNNGDTFDTEKGQMNFYPAQYDVGFKYELYENNAISPDKAEEFTYDLLDELGIILDESSVIKEGTPYVNNYSFKFSQKINDIYVRGNGVTTAFYPDHTRLFMGGWINGLSMMELYDVEKASQAGRDHIFLYDELLSPECNLSYNPDHDDGAYLTIIHERPVYQMYAGTCQTPYMDGHYHWYEVYVDAITGKPLFAKNLPVF